MVIANGNAIGEFPKKINQHHPPESGEPHHYIDIKKLTDEMRAPMVVTQPYVCIIGQHGEDTNLSQE